jgi:hypothetical protein
MRERSEYDDYMDALLLSTAATLDGVDKEDVASIGMMLVAYSIKDRPSREADLARLLDFLHEIWGLERGAKH